MNPVTAAAPSVEVLPAWKQLLVIYGPLGVLAAICLYAAWHLYKDLKAERSARLEDAAKHQEEMRKMEERYISKTETQIEKYHDLAKALNAVVDSALRRYPRNSGGGPYGGQGPG